MSTLLVQGDAREIPLADRSVQCAVTSPPYWGLRDYKVVGQIGLEPTLGEYLAVMVGAFREVRRVLRDDGTCWVNMGDGYANDAKGPRGADKTTLTGQGDYQMLANPPGLQKGWRGTPGLKRKDLLLQPHRLMIALQDDGWYVRADNIWFKPNAMPTNVKDRPHVAHEHVILLSKRPRYFYDDVAVMEPTTGNAHARGSGVNPKARTLDANLDNARRPRQNASFSAAVSGIVAARNLRSVWRIPTHPCREAHFATFPLELARRCIKAGTSERGRCPHCGAPWRRVVEKIPTGQTQKMVDGWDTGAGGHGSIHRNGREAGKAGKPVLTIITTHWFPTCKCPAHEPVPCVVLDPFGGAGTTAMAAKELGRHCVIVERKWEYLQIAAPRIARHQPRPPRVRRARRNPGSASGAPGLFDEVPA